METMTHETTNNLLRLIPLAIFTVACAAILVAVGAFDDATAAQPQRHAPEMARARISVPPTSPPELVAAEGLDGLANPFIGVYHVGLAPGLQLTTAPSVACTGTKPGVTCAVEIKLSLAGDYYLAVYRDWYGSPQDGDAFIQLWP
jgi:hypothetical protein